MTPKYIAAQLNTRNGYDIVLQGNDKNCNVTSTGKYLDSLEYWRRIKSLSEEVIKEMTETTPSKLPFSIFH